jgi:hypothetical protein
MESIAPQLIDLIPPTILLSVAVYLVRFFGKVISDQKPFSDDRGWEIEISGTFFFLIIIFDIVLGISGALNFGDFGIGHLIRLIIVIFLIIWLWIIGMFFTEKVYGVKLPQIQKLVEIITEKQGDFKGVSNKFLTINYYITLWFFPIIFVYILAIEYKSGSFFWAILIGSQILIGFILVALNYSLNKTRLPRIDIFFANGKNSIHNATLLKFNKDNIRIKQGEMIVVISRNYVQRIEFLPPKNINPEKK